MKIKTAHYEYMKGKILPIMVEISLSEYQDAGLSEKRYRWDMSYKAGLTTFICDEIYPYANDNHIDTALRKITNTK